MNFVFATDPHITNINPSSRLDNFPETILAKLDWVVEYCNSVDANLILGGDILDSYATHPQVIYRVASILSKAKHQIFSVIGNHDVYGQTSDTITNVILGVLFATGVIHNITMDPLIVTDGNVKVQLTGGNYTNNMESHKELYSTVKVPEADKAIHVVHGFLIRKHWPTLDKNYTLISEVQTEADVTCAGHEHSGFGVVEFDDRYFMNPGALGRISASETEMARMPRIGLIQFTKTSNVVSLIDVPFALPGEEVLSRERIIEEKAREAKLIEIKEQLDNSDFATASTIEEIFEEQAKITKVPKPVYDLSKKAFDEYCYANS